MKTSSQAPDIAVVIPYFQRERGVLERCIRSIITQTHSESFQIIVVDDGSPVPAERELESIACKENQILLVKQVNSGPGAARNAGLDNVMHGTKYVALLDSDDKWCDDFLADAVSSLDKGYDLFIGNSRRVGKKKTRFEWSNNPNYNISASEHLLIDSEREIYEYQGNFFDLLVHQSSIIGPAAMAYRYDKYRSIRYTVKLFNGQDRLFKLSLKEAARRVAFSSKIYAEEGEGINIFDKSQWGSERSLGFLSSYIELPKAILKEIDLNSSQRNFVLWQLKQSRYSFVASLLHLIKSRKKVDWRSVIRTFRNDPMTALLFLPNAIKVVLAKIFGKKLTDIIGSN